MPDELVHSIDFNEGHMFLQTCEWWHGIAILDSFYLIFAALTYFIYNATYYNYRFLILWTQLSLKFLFNQLSKGLTLSRVCQTYFYIKVRVDNEVIKFKLADIYYMTVIWKHCARR